MIEVVLDTNVLLAALINPRGVNMRVLRTIVAQGSIFHVCYSSQMFAEYEDVLSRPVVTGRGLQPEARRLLSLVRSIGEEVVPKPVYALVYPDRKDRPFLEVAVYVDGVLLTNNLKDFPFLGVNVLAPEEFLAWCAERGLIT